MKRVLLSSRQYGCGFFPGPSPRGLILLAFDVTDQQPGISKLCRQGCQYCVIGGGPVTMIVSAQRQRMYLYVSSPAVHLFQPFQFSSGMTCGLMPAINHSLGKVGSESHLHPVSWQGSRTCEGIGNTAARV